MSIDKVELAKRIREFEVKILKEFREGKIPGTIHPCIGQEYTTVEVVSQLRKGDVITSNHRGHGHFLAYTNCVLSGKIEQKNFDMLYDELRGLKTGVNKGASLSQHLGIEDFYMTGIQAGFVPVATGAALAEKMKGDGNMVVCFIGDGTFGQGVLYESMNLASLWGLPICFVVEDNKYAMSTSVASSIAGYPDSMSARFEAFGIREAKEDIREVFPSYKIVDTYRYCGHSGNDKNIYRDKEEEKEWLGKDYLDGYLLEEL